MWGAHDGMGWWMVFGMIWMVILWGAVIWLIAWGVSQFAGRDRHDGESPLDIARRRYASGEITREQFEQLQRDLG
jgi:putative membrane protein